jgi:hypothetical protein
LGIDERDTLAVDREAGTKVICGNHTGYADAFKSIDRSDRIRASSSTVFIPQSMIGLALRQAMPFSRLSLAKLDGLQCRIESIEALLAAGSLATLLCTPVTDLYVLLIMKAPRAHSIQFTLRRTEYLRG